jgi:NADH-quinone oxidoreductase subunit N
MLLPAQFSEPILGQQIGDLCRVAPEIVLCAFGILIMVLDPFVVAVHKRILGWLGFAGALAGLVAVRLAAQNGGPAYGGLFRVDDFSIFFHVLVTGAAALAILGSLDYLDQERIQKGEYYALVLFATAGMGLLSGAQELVTAFLGLEMSSISSYILAGFRRNSLKSNESSLKYFLLGSFATAFFLYGIAMTYGATGSTRFENIQSALLHAEASGPAGSLVIFGLGLIFVGLGFKVVIAPFQIYAPDVYEGAPTPVTALLASAPKAATFAVMLRIFYVAFGPVSHIWFWAVWISAVLTMFIGNLSALLQTNVKRMLAYSSISHAGYILVAFAASSEVGIAAVLFYLVAYALMKIGAFTVVSHLGGPGEKRLEIADYAGLGRKQPVVAACFTLFLLSLLGLPATGGFLGKFYAFQAGLDARLFWLVVLAALNSVIGSYYYLRIIVAMYFRDTQDDWTPARVTVPIALVLLIAAAGTIYLGLFPSRVMAFAIHSAAFLR